MMKLLYNIILPQWLYFIINENSFLYNISKYRVKNIELYNHIRIYSLTRIVILGRVIPLVEPT